MGDYSRDTFKLTNVMHQVLSGESVLEPRHYVGVRLQQGVPVLDSDINELEDIRKSEVRTLLNYFIGNGVPSGVNGFGISGSGAANSFTVDAGLILIDGLVVVNPAVTTYSTQPESASLPALTTPAGGLERTDLVYLDIWEQETGAEDTVNADERIINQYIGIETARRLERRWAVRVAEGVSDLGGVAMETGHHYTTLALMERAAGNASITDSMIIDQRRQGITLADNLKIPIYLRRGIETINSQRFANMLNGLRTTLFARLLDNSIPYQVLAGPDQQRQEMLIMMSTQELMHLCQIGENQALAGSLDNDDALSFMERLYDAQDAWLAVIADIGNDGGVADSFMNEYRSYLGSPSSTSGLYAELDNLINAVVAQEELNSWLSSSIGNLPEGSVDAVYLTALPYEVLAATNTYDFTYEVTANFTTPETDEEFEVIVNLDGAFGSYSVDQEALTFTPPEQSAVITVSITPSGGLASAELDVVVQAVRNPLNIRSSQLPITLEVGELPPVANFYFYTGPLSAVDRRFEIPQNHLTRPQGRNVLFKLKNDSAGETRTYRVRGQIVPNIGTTTGWAPLALTEIADSPLVLGPGTDTDVLVNVIANDGGNVPPVGTTGEIISTAELIEVDGTPVSEPQDPLTVTVDFVVDDPI